ncbi:MAG: fused response regulator/phosphatase [Planctomycetes bacterium]|nr:fused response regulator/phosphatase [Planctomycetota bacterium]
MTRETISSSRAAGVQDLTTPTPKLKALVADDAPSNRRVLEALLSHLGFLVVTAQDGEEAIERFGAERPDVVLLDVVMPRMDGFDACRRIKEMAKEQFVPVLFLTALTEEDVVAKCIDAGGDDFLSRPFSASVLRAKIKALDRFRALHATMRAQARDLEGHQARMLREIELGTEVLSRIIRADDLAASNLHVLRSPASMFSGDLLMVARTPSGGQRVFLGDFTGHGLPAAIGALPVSEIFYSRTSSGVQIPDLVCHIDAKLQAILPDGVFLAACVLELTSDERRLIAWNGGIPDAIVFRPGAGIVRRFESTGLPLGLGVTAEEASRSLCVERVRPGDRVYIYSDGVIELAAPGGEMFGQERLERFMPPTAAPEEIFSSVVGSLENFRGGAEQLDDVTMIEVVADGSLLQPQSDGSRSMKEHPPLFGWKFTLDMGPAALRALNPLPLLMGHLKELRLPHSQEQAIYLILAELYTNALDHGVLKLDSSTKETSDGFAQYHEMREEALALVSSGLIRISVGIERNGPDYLLRVQVQDSGSGFSFSPCRSALDGNEGASGRGIALVEHLCETVTYTAGGTCAEAIYRIHGASREMLGP